MAHIVGLDVFKYSLGDDTNSKAEILQLLTMSCSQSAIISSKLSKIHKSIARLLSRGHFSMIDISSHIAGSLSVGPLQIPLDADRELDRGWEM